MTHDPQVLQVLSIALAATGMVVLGRAKKMLTPPRTERCAACGRQLVGRRRCLHCG